MRICLYPAVVALCLVVAPQRSVQPSGLANGALLADQPFSRELTDSWRRTKQGWETNRGWTGTPPPLSPMTGVHPLVVAGLQLFGSLTALTAWGLWEPHDNMLAVKSEWRHGQS